MANVYVYSGATGGGTGADWANAYTTLAAAGTAKAAGDVFYVAHDHAETTAAALTLAFPGTDASPNRVYCVNRAGSVPPVSADLRTTATVSTTGTSSITFSGTVTEYYGLIFISGDATSTASITIGVNGRFAKFVSCSFRLGNTSVSSRINIGSTTSSVTILENVTVKPSTSNQFMQVNGRAVWRNTPSVLVAGGVVSSTGFILPVNSANLFCEGLDLSGLSVSLVQAQTGAACTVMFKDCKLGAGSIAGGPPTVMHGWEVTAIRCDGGDTNYRTEKHTWCAAMTTETTIVRSGGATDGTTAISWKIVTTANSRWDVPFESLPITVWNETVGSAITVTVQGIWGTASVPNNDDIWIDVEYLGTSGFPLASKATSTKADGLAAGAAIPAGSGTWGGSTTKFAMAVTITPQEKGPLTVYVKAAKVSSTFYVDPKPVIT